MTSHRYTWAATTILLAGAGVVWAADPPAEQPPAPGEEVMTPTRLGVRLTPSMATGISRLWMQDDLWREADMTDQQERQLADAIARRMMGAAHRDGGEGRAGLEYLIETALATHMKVTAQNCQEFAEKVEPLAKSMQELLDGSIEDARSILSEEQWKRVQPEVDALKHRTERFEKRLQGYREGQVGENENPFDELDPNADEFNKPKSDARVRNARRMVDWEIRRTTTWDWSRFLAGAASLFKFDDAQRAKGEAILAEYRKKADGIQTPDWRARVRRNGTLVGLRWQLGDVPKAPWVFHLQQQYDEDLRPLLDLRAAFYKEVLALATPQQRAEVLNDTREVLKKHGIDVGEPDMTLLQGLIQ